MTKSFEEMGDDETVDELVQTLSQALKSENIDEKLVDDLVDNIIAKSGVDNPIIGNFVLIAELIDDNGDPQIMVATSERLPEWIARGMLSVADDYLSGPIGIEWTDDGG